MNEKLKEKIKTLEDRDIKLSDEIRRIGAADIDTLINEMGIDIAAVAELLDVDRKSVHRWLGGFFIPQQKACKIIRILLTAAEEIREDWKEIATGWNGQYHKAVRMTLYQKPVLRILNSGKDLDEKIQKLTAHTMTMWAKGKSNV